MPLSSVLYRVFLFFHFTDLGIPLIVCIHMKYPYIIFAFLLISLAGCSDWDTRWDPLLPMIDIVEKWWSHIAYGVMTESGIMTARHVHMQCVKTPPCRYYRVSDRSEVMPSGKDDISWQRDITSIGVLWWESIVRREQDLSVGMAVYALVLWDGIWKRQEGKIISLSGSYVGYDTTLSGTTFTWAIEIDIVLEPWASGTPIWTLSGWLIGIMSASDDIGKRGYIVR